MTLPELKSELAKYQYLEDTNIIDVTLASIISTRLKLGEPIWIVLIGASSGGKSQILRPMALTDKEFMHRVDDITENTFLSGSNMKSGEPSLLKRIGTSGIIVVSDLTVIFSKAKETMGTILSQFRMIYDGEMTKFIGTSIVPLQWKGSLGIIAGSTPSIYANFEEVSDMGERFIYYRMKEYDSRKATKLALGRKVYGKDLDNILSGLYSEYIRDIIKSADISITISEEVHDRIIEISSLAEKIRTTISMDWKGDKINRVPVPALPMRVALQLISLARGLSVMRGRELDENDLSIIDWCAYSLANEEKRSVLKILCSLPIGIYASTTSIADKIGLDTSVTRNVLQNLTAVSVLERSGTNEGLQWRIRNDADRLVLRRINSVVDDQNIISRVVTSEEEDEVSLVANQSFDKFQ